MEATHLLLLLLLTLIRKDVDSSLTVVSQSNLFSPRQFGRQIQLTSVLPTNESFVINYEEGYFLCPKEANAFPKRFRLSRICDGFADCALGSDELFRELKCATDCEPPCSSHGICMRANVLDPKGHCRCDDGFGGSDCSFRNVNECQYRPCGNNAECIDKVDGYECKCLPGYEGNNGQECTSVDDVLANVKNVLKSTDSSQFIDPNIDLAASFNGPSAPQKNKQPVASYATTEASPLSPKPLSIVLPVSPTDVVDKVKEILGNNVRTDSKMDDPLVIPNVVETNSQLSDFETAPFDTTPSPTKKPPMQSRTTPRPQTLFNPEKEASLRLSDQEEELFLKELNLIEPQISREDPRLQACRSQFERCRDPRDSCMKDLQSCSLSVLDVAEGTRGRLWGECIMDHHMCIMNQEPFCMQGFQKCSFAAIEVLKNMLPRKPFSENIEESKSPRLRIQGAEEDGPFTLSFHFRVCVNGYLDCFEVSQRSTEDCKGEFDACSLRLLNTSRGALTVRTQVTIPGLSECIQSFVECIDAEGITCYADYNMCTVVALDDYTSNQPQEDDDSATRPTPIKKTTTPLYKKTTVSKSTTQRPISVFSPSMSVTKDPDGGSSVLEICKQFRAPNKFGSFSGRPAASTVDCVWDYFSCTKRYGSYPQNKDCCDGRFKLCCEHIMNGGHGSGGSFESITTTEASNSFDPQKDDCSLKLSECSRRGFKSIRQCKLEYTKCTSSLDGIHPSTKRPINDIDIPQLPGFLRPQFTSTIKPIQDLNLPQNQEFVLQNGEKDPFPSLVGQGETQVIRVDEEFMACLLEQFDCLEYCPPLKKCSDLAGLDLSNSDNFVSGSESTSQEFFLPPVNFSLIGSDLLSSAEDKERMFCVREFFACKGPSEDCKLMFKACVDRQESFSVDDLCRGVEGRPENYLVPHPLDCTKFYSCQTLGFGLGYKAHLMDCPFSTGFDRKLKICNFIQSLPRCRRDRGSRRTARLLSGTLAMNERSGAHVGEVGFLTSQIASSSDKTQAQSVGLFLLSFLGNIIFRHS